MTAVFTWWNFLESSCAPQKTVLRINLDETAVKTWMAPSKGLMTSSLYQEGHCDRRVAPVTRRQQRTCLTHVALVCDQPEIQPHLPHVIVGNEAVLPLYIQRAVEPQLFRNVFLVRRKSAWIDAGYMVVIIKLLGTVLKPFLDSYQPILLMDALPAHLAPKVFRAAARCGIWVVVVPAKLTWLIQPADTHAFLKYKMFLRKRYMEVRARSSDGQLHLREVLMAMNDAVRYVFQAHEWRRAFDEDGFGHRQMYIRQSVARAAGLQLPLSIPAELPTLCQLRSIWPHGAYVPLDDVFSCLISHPREVAHSQPERHAMHHTAPHDTQPDDEAESWLERLRPRRPASFAHSAVYDVDGDSSGSVIGGPSSATWPTMDAAAPAAAAHETRTPRRVARPIAASRPSATTSAPHLRAAAPS